jgi:hypothetical protein
MKYQFNPESKFEPRRGFETVMLTVIRNSAEAITVPQIVAMLLASGEYVRVAPQAAKLRADKPVKFLVKTWAVAGILNISQ